MSRGLLGLVLVLCILGGLAGLAVTGLSGPGPAIRPTSSATGLPVAGTAAGTAPGTAAGKTAGKGAGTGAIGGGSDLGPLAAACTADAQGVATAVQAYYAQTGAYPRSISQLVPTWMRALPTSTHYSIEIDAAGRVGVFPAGASLTGTVPDSASFDLHPELCRSVPR